MLALSLLHPLILTAGAAASLACALRQGRRPA
jgi:hypothetical protein